MVNDEAEREPGSSPTIGDMRGQGVVGVHVTCLGSRCGRSATIPLDSIGLADDTPLVEVALRRRWLCDRCKGWRMSVVLVREEREGGP